jgi:hypothetical protein
MEGQALAAIDTRLAGLLLVPLALFFVGCESSDKRATPHVDASSTPAPMVTASATAAPSAMQVVTETLDNGVVVRELGAIRGRIAPERTKYIVGEPIFVKLEVRNAASGPLVFDEGSDYFNRPVPLRYRWVVRDDAGAVLCDAGKRGARLGGGMGHPVELAPGETFRETHLLNPACDALTKPGRYRLSVVRVFTDRTTRSRDAACDDMAPPDPTALAPDAPDPSGVRDAACMARLRSFPAVAAEFALELGEWDEAAMRAELAAMPSAREAARTEGDRSREGAMTTYGSWYCEHVRCDCSDDVRYQGARDWFSKALSRVPSKMPANCPSR